MKLVKVVCTQCLLNDIKQKNPLNSILPHFCSSEFITNVLSSIHHWAEALLKISGILATHKSVLHVSSHCIVKAKALLFCNN